jgi:manganese/zinc/iron transport system ATP- binding protein
MKFFSSEKSNESDLGQYPEHSASSPLSVHAMTVAYDQKPVLWDIDYDAPASSLVAIVGPNGAGKTTFVRACLGLIPRATGDVRFWGKPYESLRARVGYVPQRETVDWDFPVSALDVVAMGRYAKIGWFRRVGKQHLDFARSCLADVELADFADRQINQLSGGQQQRVFLARALAQEADLYFMDEPFAGVDAATEKAIFAVLQKLRDTGKTVLCVHHDLPTVKEYFDSVILLNTHVVAAGSIEDTFHEENLFKTYGGRLTLLDEVSQAIARTTRGN